MGRIPLCVVFLSGCFFGNGDDGGGGGGGGGGTRPDANLVDACMPKTCSAEGISCGTLDDGCGFTVECGTCTGLATCGGGGTPNVCAIPEADRACSDGWCWEAPAPLSFIPTNVFARAVTDVWVVGLRGTVMHYDGQHWRTVDAGTTADLNAVWMASATDGWIVGTGGTVRRWNGTQWNAVASGTTASLNGVWGSAANNVVIVGDNVGKRWNGSNLLDVAVTTPLLRDVFIAGTTVFAVGEGYVWELVTATWTKRTGDSPTFTSYTLSNIGGTATNVYALGRSRSFTSGEDLGFHWTGSGWGSFSDPGDPEWTDVYADGTTVYGASDESIANLADLSRVTGPGEMLAVAGTSGRTFAATYPQDGDQLWSGTAGAWNVPPSFGARVHRSHVAAVGDSVWFAGPDVGVTEWRNGLVDHDTNSSYALVGIAGSARDNVWAIDDWDSYHFDGIRWERVDAPAFVRAEAIVMVGSEPALVGEDVYIRANGMWVKQTVPTDANYTAADEQAGELTIVGESTAMAEARVVRQVAGVWTELPKPTMQHACGVAVGGPDDVWVSGWNYVSSTVDDGVIAHWDGQAWSVETRAGAGKLCAIEQHGGELWVAGTALHRRAANGTWTTSTPVRAGSIRGLRSLGTTLWAVGDYGAILRRE